MFGAVAGGGGGVGGGGGTLDRFYRHQKFILLETQLRLFGWGVTLSKK